MDRSHPILLRSNPILLLSAGSDAPQLGSEQRTIIRMGLWTGNTRNQSIHVPKHGKLTGKQERSHIPDLFKISDFNFSWLQIHVKHARVVTVAHFSEIQMWEFGLTCIKSLSFKQSQGGRQKEEKRRRGEENEELAAEPGAEAADLLGSFRPARIHPIMRLFTFQLSVRKAALK